MRAAEGLALAPSIAAPKTRVEARIERQLVDAEATTSTPLRCP